mmetsp:Transcript_23987/g.66208  ORF Transcript_23987/g.66208 Transcript_23987/m.66208 type:complete len:106 (+) Transcript_23987:332-649(+)
MFFFVENGSVAAVRCTPSCVGSSSAEPRPAPHCWPLAALLAWDRCFSLGLQRAHIGVIMIDRLGEVIIVSRGDYNGTVVNPWQSQVPTNALQFPTHEHAHVRSSL